jgi:DNA-binding beta-propeller fold protein YncE
MTINRGAATIVSLVTLLGLPAAGTLTTSTHAASAKPTLRIRARIPIGELAGGIVSAAGSIWAVTVYPKQQVVQIDPATNRVVGRIFLGGTPSPGDVAWITYGAGALWVSRAESNEVDRIDPASSTITARIVIDEPYDVAVAGNSVYVPEFDPYKWSVIDAATGKVTTSQPATGPSSAVVDHGAVWILLHRSQTVIRVDPATNSVTHRMRVITGGSVPERIAAGFGSVWVADPRSTSIARLDETKGKQLVEIDLPYEPLFNPYPITTGGGFVWFGTDHAVGRINPATNRVAGMIKLAYDNKTCGPATDYPCTDGIAYAAGSVWVADWNNQQILRIDAR